jgi:hypothetical protein
MTHQGNLNGQEKPTGPALPVDQPSIEGLSQKFPNTTCHRPLKDFALQPFLPHAETGTLVSRPRELPPRPLAEPCVNLSVHTAPITRPCHTNVANAQTVSGLGAPSV